MAETKVARKTKKSKESIQETEVKLNEIEKETTVVEDDVKVDVEIDCRSCSNSSNQCVYIRRKRSI